MFFIIFQNNCYFDRLTFVAESWNLEMNVQDNPNLHKRLFLQ